MSILRERHVDLEVHRAPNHFFIESSYLECWLLVFDNEQPCYGVIQSEDWLGFSVNLTRWLTAGSDLYRFK